MRAGEGGGDGVMVAPPPCSLSLGFIAAAERGVESGEERKKREKGQGANGARVAGSRAAQGI